MQSARKKAVMAAVRQAQENGFKGYSVSLRKKVEVKPSDRIIVKTTKLKNGNASVMVMGHVNVKGKEYKIPRFIGQYPA